MATFTKITWKKRDHRDARILKNRHKKVRRKLAKKADAKKKA